MKHKDLLRRSKMPFGQYPKPVKCIRRLHILLVQDSSQYPPLSVPLLPPSLDLVNYMPIQWTCIQRLINNVLLLVEEEQSKQHSSE
jgi:hypothetical protein